MTVIKTRGRAHKRELRSYEITGRGVVVGDAMRAFEGVITGVPRFVGDEGDARPGRLSPA